MNAADVLRSLDGFLWEAVTLMPPEFFAEPFYPIDKMDTVLGPMSELEKALFTIQEDLFDCLVTNFQLDDEDDYKIIEFDEWLTDASKDEFALKCRLQTGLNEAGMLEIRNQYFATMEFLELVTTQRFAFKSEDFRIFYREGFIVTIQRINLLATLAN
jgi:hypothetical protein